MGGDGGAVVPREIMLGKHQKRGHQLQQEMRLTNLGRVTHCALSGLALKRPIVSCYLGNLYNKDAVLTFLLEMAQLKSDATPLHQLTESQRLHRIVLEDKQIQFSHITKLSDIIPCTVIMKHDRVDNGNSNNNNNHLIGSSSHDITNYIICPITHLPADGALPLIVMRDCGCVMSLKGIEQVNGLAQRTEDPITKENLRSCCLCLAPLGARYQHGFSPTSSTTTTTISHDNDQEVCNDEQSILLKKKKIPKKNQAVLDQERLASFPLQEGEEPYIPLIPTEEQAVILEAVMLAKLTYLGRPLPQAVEQQLKRQRITNLISSADDQSELLTDGAIALSIAAYPYVLKQNQQNGTQQQQHPNTPQLLQSRDLLFPPQHPFRSLVDQALHNPLLPEAVLDQDNNTNDGENNHSKDQFLPSVDYNKFTKSLYSHYLPAVAGSIETVVRVGGQLSEGNDSNDQIATASTTQSQKLYHHKNLNTPTKVSSLK